MVRTGNGDSLLISDQYLKICEVNILDVNRM
jgi:hypothetical protein